MKLGLLFTTVFLSCTCLIHCSGASGDVSDAATDTTPNGDGASTTSDGGGDAGQSGDATSDTTEHDTPSPHFFGLNMHDHYPGAQITPYGLIRLWDIGVTWASLETAEGQYAMENIGRLDTYAKDARKAGVDVMYVVGQVPRWANGMSDQDCGIRPTGSCVPPADWKYFTDFLTTIASRYSGSASSSNPQTGCASSEPQCNGVIEIYELWNEPSDTTEWLSGKADPQFVEMTQLAMQTIHAIDPAARVASPGNTSSNTKFMDDYWASDAGPLTTFDSIDFHMYSSQTEPVPENIISSVGNLKNVMSKYGINAPLLNSEGAWCIESTCTAPNTGEEMGDYAARYILLNFAMRSRSFVWYTYDGQGSQGLWNNDTQSLRATGVAYEAVGTWLLGSKLGKAGCLDAQGKLQADIFQCTKVDGTYVVDFTDVNGNPAEVVWFVKTAAGSVDWSATYDYTVPSPFTKAQDLGGNAVPVNKGVVTVGAGPLLLD